MEQPAATHDPALLDVQLAFEHWRANRASRRSATPEHLKTLAVGLLGQHRISAICNSLGINNVTFKHWAGTRSPKSSKAFVTLPKADTAPQSMQTHELRIILPNGVQVHAHHSYTATELLAAANALSHLS